MKLLCELMDDIFTGDDGEFDFSFDAEDGDEPTEDDGLEDDGLEDDDIIKRRLRKSLGLSDEDVTVGDENEEEFQDFDNEQDVESDDNLDSPPTEQKRMDTSSFHRALIQLLDRNNDSGDRDRSIDGQ